MSISRYLYLYIYLYLLLKEVEGMSSPQLHYDVVRFLHRLHPVITWSSHLGDRLPNPPSQISGAFPNRGSHNRRPCAGVTPPVARPPRPRTRRLLNQESASAPSSHPPATPVPSFAPRILISRDTFQLPPPPIHIPTPSGFARLFSP